MNDKLIGKYVKHWTGRYGIITGKIELSGLTYYTITFNSFSTGVGLADEFEIVY